ncbi:MAG: saccharopine dehydrogenase NADP-binding domain-containing protein [Planctomycetota bacterium]
MHRLLLLGAGKIGRMIAKLLIDSGDFEVSVGDHDQATLQSLARLVPVETVLVDATDPSSLDAAMASADSVMSALGFEHNPNVAAAALRAGISYFDLTEDVESTRAVREIAASAPRGQVFMPQCGLAPGFISIVAAGLANRFEKLDKVHMRVGAIPQFPTGQIKYNLSWSTAGLINEYCKLCEAIEEHGRIEVLPLEGLEEFSIDGVSYEAFNTSGGIGTMCETLKGRVRELNYKTIRYPGHRNLMFFLVNELRLNKKQELLREILEASVPRTDQDVVVTLCTVSGWQNDRLTQYTDVRKIYASEIDGERWTAIQITTAAGACAALDLWRNGQLPDSGFLLQEQVSLKSFLENRFGRYFANDPARPAPVWN